MILCSTKNVSSNYFITRVRITCCFSTGSSTRTKTIGFGDTTCCHYIKPILVVPRVPITIGRTTMIPASTGRNRTISAKAPCSLYEDRTHPPGSKDQCPNQLGEQTILRMMKDSNPDFIGTGFSTLPLTGARSTTELIIQFILLAR